MGARAHELVVDFFASENLDGDKICALEVGAERGEGSTFFLHSFFARRGVLFYSVDFEKAAWRRARAVVGGAAYRMTGEKFLAEVFPRFGMRIIFAYLDNFDWRYRFWDDKTAARIIGKQAQFYRRQGLELNNRNSMRAHLEQAKSVCRFAAPGCVVLFDDTWPLSGGGYDGKGGAAVPHLLGQGFRVLSQSPPESETSKGYVALKKE